MADARSIRANSNPAARVRGGSRAHAAPTMHSSKSMYRPISPGAQYEQHLARLEANRARAETLGSVRRSPSLLAGLLVCGRCHCRMQVRYGGPRRLHSYTCNRLATNYGGDYCQYLPGAPVDAFVSQRVLTALNRPP